MRPFLTAAGPPAYGDARRYTRVNSCWYVYGKLVDASHETSKVRFDRSNWMWAGTSCEELRAWDGDYRDLDGDPDLLFIFASNLLPNLYGEVTEFRTEIAKPCPRCGSSYRDTGYLKRHSLVPEWEGVPELKTILRENQHRVLVEYCSRCGRMEYKIVGKRRPFRAQTTEFRRRQKAVLTTWRELGQVVRRDWGQSAFGRQDDLE